MGISTQTMSGLSSIVAGSKRITRATSIAAMSSPQYPLLADTVL